MPRKTLLYLILTLVFFRAFRMLQSEKKQVKGKYGPYRPKYSNCMPDLRFFF